MSHPDSSSLESVVLFQNDLLFSVFAFIGHRGRLILISFEKCEMKKEVKYMFFISYKFMIDPDIYRPYRVCLPQWRDETRTEIARQEKCSPRKRNRKSEHRAARSQHEESAVVVFAQFFLLFLYNT